MNDIKTNLNNTIDLAWIIENERQDYLIKNGYLEDFTLYEKFIMKFPRITKILLVWGVCFLVLAVLIPITKASAYEGENHARFLNYFPVEKTLIGCYNDRTKKTRGLDKSWRCLKGWDHNIKLPPRKDIVVWLKYFNEFEIINRLSIVNFESDFEETAENPFAKWYVQTLKSHGVKPDINSQLKWLKKRQDAQKVVKTRGGSLRCGYYWNNYNYKDGFEAGEYGVLSCLYRYHYHAHKGTWYAKRGIKGTKFYKEYLFGGKY